MHQHHVDEGGGEKREKGAYSSFTILFSALGFRGKCVPSQYIYLQWEIPFYARTILWRTCFSEDK